MRNIDRLRKMKPKKLALFFDKLINAEGCSFCVFDKVCERQPFYDGKCREGILKWLKQEVKK